MPQGGDISDSEAACMAIKSKVSAENAASLRASSFEDQEPNQEVLDSCSLEQMHTNPSDLVDPINLNNLHDAEPKASKRKSVGFAVEPVEELWEHHKEVEQKRKENAESNPFGKIPPELSHLDKKVQAPKPLPRSQPVTKPKRVMRLDDLPDLPSRAVKEISVINKNTALNFNYHEVVFPLRRDRILVDVKYSSLSSFDIAKLKKYTYNISNERVGLGYSFFGEVAELGKDYQNSDVFRKGTKVFGVTNPLEKKGSLQSCVIINPSDVLIPIHDEDLEKIALIDLQLSLSVMLSESKFKIDDELIHDQHSTVETDNSQINTEHKKMPAKAAYNIENELSTEAKFSVFGSEYCRAKQSLELMDPVFLKQESANILINGGDTNLGMTLSQIIASSLYKDLKRFNVTLIVLEKNYQVMKNFVESINFSSSGNFNIVAFDMVNEDLFVTGERIPINYKKVPYFATEVFESILKIIPQSQKINKNNIHEAKLDLFIDIVGSKKMFQKAVNVTKIDDINFPFKARLEEGVKPSSIFGKSKEPLFMKLMKPKNSKSCYVSYCNFYLSEPSYQVDKIFGGSRGLLDPWGLSWTQGLANQFVGKYNFYEKNDLEIQKAWVEEALRLVLAGELKFRVNYIVDWRRNFRKDIDELRKKDGLIVFQVESY